MKFIRPVLAVLALTITVGSTDALAPAGRRRTAGTDDLLYHQHR